MSMDQWQWYRIIYVTDLKKGFVVIVVIDVRIFTASRFLANIKSWLLCFPILIEKWHFLGKGWLTLDFTICWFIGNWLLGEYWVTYDDWSLVETNVFAASSSPASHTSCLWVILSLICFAMPCEKAAFGASDRLVMQIRKDTGCLVYGASGFWAGGEV